MISVFLLAVFLVSNILLIMFSCDTVEVFGVEVLVYCLVVIKVFVEKTSLMGVCLFCR